MFRRQLEIIGENQKNLEEKRVLIVGAGGLGNSVATSISCIGLKEIYIIDFDNIEIHNIHRQFNFSKDDVGEFKSEVLANKLDRCDTKFYSFSESFHEFLKREIEVDLIIDCTDNFEVREEINEYAKKNSLVWLYGSVEGWSGQVCLFENGDFSIFNKPKEHKVKGVMPSMVSLVGSIQANIATKYLSNMEVSKDELYFITFKDTIDVKKFKI
jgi:adenylyltransferase/sulfurtransferase